MYIYRESHLPEYGWFQACFICYTITAQTHHYNTQIVKNSLIENICYLCPVCIKTLEKDSILKHQFEKCVNKYLNYCKNS